MSPLTIFAATSYGPHTALTGGRLRRDNVLAALARRGHEIDRLDLTARPGAASAVEGARLAMAGRLRRRAERADVVLLGDVFCLPMLPALRRAGRPVVVDLVDSPYRLVRAAPRASVRERLVAASQSAQLLPVMQALLPMADGVTYISVEDEEVDLAAVRRIPPTGIVPNGVHTDLFDVPLTPPPAAGYLAWLADWTYPPNRESFAWFARTVAPELSDEHLARLRLFGAGDPSAALGREPADQRMRRLVGHAGFVDPLSAVYEGARAVVAPVVRGAGLNNKVLEPLAAGRSVITTEVGSRGMPPEIRRHLRITATPASMAAEIASVLEGPVRVDDAERARASVSSLSWDKAGVAMEEQLLRAIRGRAAAGAPGGLASGRP